MIAIGDRVLVLRNPSQQEDPDEAWIPELEEIIGSYGTVVEDCHPYADDSIYIMVDVDDYDEFLIPQPILTKLE